MNIPDRYFLTPAQKSKAKRQLCVLLKAGAIDKAMIPYLKAINKMPGLMTQFCCEGHEGDTDNKGMGNLIIRMSSTAFDKIVLGQTMIMSDPGHTSFEFFDPKYCGCRIITTFNREHRDDVVNRLVDDLGCRLGIKEYIDKRNKGRAKWVNALTKKVPKDKRRKAKEKLYSLFGIYP